MTWTNIAMDTYLAPHMSELKTADIPDRSNAVAASEAWLTRFTLKAMFQINLPAQVRQYLFMFIRRSAATARLHAQARALTLEFLAKNSNEQPALMLYTRAIDCWDAFLAQGWQATVFWSFIIERPREIFTGSESSFARLNGLHNDGKHAESRIEAGELSADSTFTMWMTPAGLVSAKHSLTWLETAELVDCLQVWNQVIERDLDDAAARHAQGT